MERFRGGLAFKAHRLLNRSSLGSRVIKKKNRFRVSGFGLLCRGSGYRGTSLMRNVLYQGSAQVDMVAWAAQSPSYRGTSLIRNVLLLGPYGRPMPRARRWSYGVGQFLMSQVNLNARSNTHTRTHGTARTMYLPKTVRSLLTQHGRIFLGLRV